MARGKYVEEWITQRGGLAHGIDVREANFSRRDVDEALSLNRVRRVRRSWLMTRSADPAEVTAIRAGGRLTCVSAAKKAQLWVPDFSGIHISVPPTASRFDRTELTVHWARGPVPAPARQAQEPLLNVLSHVALCLPRMDALAVWESALHTGEVHPGMLQRVTWSSPSARELADAASVLSDSGLETYAVVRLSAFGVPLRQQVWIDGHPVDILIGERLVVQIDGEHHLERKQRRRDIRGDARLPSRVHGAAIRLSTGAFRLAVCGADDPRGRRTGAAPRGVIKAGPARVCAASGDVRRHRTGFAATSWCRAHRLFR